MSAVARVITIGKNSEMPKVVRIPVGVSVDGCAVRAPITIRANQEICPACEGWGTDHSDNRCRRCDGDGIVEIENTAAEDRCLPAAAVGRPAGSPPAGRPSSSGMTPDALAAGGQLHVQKTEAPATVLRSGVPKSSASSPPVDLPPDAPAGALADKIVDGLTVIAGLAVFGVMAMFFLVLA